MGVFFFPHYFLPKCFVGVGVVVCSLGFMGLVLFGVGFLLLGGGREGKCGFPGGKG